jgi:hypothetical protein
MSTLYLVAVRNGAKLIGKRVLTVGIHVSGAVGGGQHQGQNGTKLIGKRVLIVSTIGNVIVPTLPTFTRQFPLLSCFLTLPHKCRECRLQAYFAKDSVIGGTQPDSPRSTHCAAC